MRLSLINIRQRLFLLNCIVVNCYYFENLMLLLFFYIFVRETENESLAEVTGATW